MATAARRDARVTAEAAPDLEAQAKRAEARFAKVHRGIDALDLWMNDLVRQGLASLETKPSTFWEEQAARLVDAQAPALAARVRRIGEAVGASRDWPDRVLEELGRVALLTHALRRLDELPPPLRLDVRHLIGWTTSEAEVERDGERVRDKWLVAAQVVDDSDRVRARRTWLRGVATGRMGLVLEFSAGGAPFGEALAPGTAFDAEVVFVPGASPLRVLLRERSEARGWSGPPPGTDIEAMLTDFAHRLASVLWLDRVGAVLPQVSVVAESDALFVRDGKGSALKLAAGDHARLLAVSGGHPVGVAGEWDGRTLRPLSVFADGGCLVLASDRRPDE